MKKNLLKAACVPAAALCLACGGGPDPSVLRDYPKTLALSVTNPADVPRPDECVALDLEPLASRAADFNPGAFAVFSGSEELASQASDADGDGRYDRVVFTVSLKPRQTKRVLVLYSPEGRKPREFPKRTQAELSVKTGGRFVGKKYVGGSFDNVAFLRVPDEHTDHTEFIRYEGPGWESDRVGYRFYLDWRNAIDLFGKKTGAMVLQDVGRDGFDSYHLPAEWGMDILKVGESLGLGTVGTWTGGRAERVAVTDSVTCRIVLNGPVESMIRTEYSGWRASGRVLDLTSELSIAAGSRLTRHALRVTGNPDNLCTGIVKLPDTERIAPEKAGAWSYLATYGKQSLAGDTLGLAVFFRRENLVRLAEDSLSHVAVLAPAGGLLEYGFLGIWQQEPGAPATRDAFVREMDRVAECLDRPVTVTY